MTRRLAALDLIGERVRLRPHRSEDAAAAFALIAGCDEILRWLVWDGPSSPAELGEYYERWAIEGDGGPDLRLALEERASGALAGSLSVRFAGHPGQGDIGYWIGVPFQRRGLGREALELCAHLAFAHLAASSLTAWVFVGNTASRRVLERTGFTLARSVPGRILKRGARVDEWHFVLLASEWRRLRSGFRPVREELRWSEVATDALESAPGLFPAG
jgi:RimJ/RimL family protein N-acetyltransferase